MDAFPRILIAGIVAVGAFSGPVKGQEKPASVNFARFEALKKLAGDWVEVGKDGKPGEKVVSTIRVTAAGSAVAETLFPGTAHEMLTVYHMDGADLVLTHYCAARNQPRMRAEPTGDAARVVFRCVGALKSEAATHMHEATLSLPGGDRFQAVWTSYTDGKPGHQGVFDLLRKKR